jgi:hypothetical protein
VNTVRRAALAENLAVVTERVAAACLAADRDPQEVTIVAITKTWPASDVELLAELGIRHVGENRDQEAREKASACAGLGLTWHFVGQLQRNKAASVARYADVVESVDRPSLAAALDRGAQQAGRRLGVCIQVDLDETPHEGGAGGVVRGGAAPDDVLSLAEQVVGCGSLALLGVMAVAPLGVDPAPAFDRLAIIHEQVMAHHPGATMRSAGMSGDLEPAIAAGATHIRLGSALLGHREPLK